MASFEDMQDEVFDFQAETKEYASNGFINSLEFSEITPGIRAFLTVETLEADVFKLQWDNMGIKVLAVSDGVNKSDKMFEDLSAFLMFYSSQYMKKFHEKLNDKLLQSLGGLESLQDRFQHDDQ